MAPFLSSPSSNIAEIFDQAWQLKQTGHSVEEILALYPQQRAALQSLLHTASQLEQNKKSTTPSPQLLRTILTQLNNSHTRVTLPDFKRSINYREYFFHSLFKGRLSAYLLTPFTNLFNFMAKKIYFFAALIVLVAAVIIGLRWYWQPANNLSSDQQLAYEVDSFSQDMADLESIADDQSLNSLDGDLSFLTVNEDSQPASVNSVSSESSSAAVPAPVIDTQELETLDNDLNVELDGLSGDLNDLDSFENDNSLDNLDDSLNGLSS